MLLPVGLTYNENREKTISVESVVNMQPEITFGGRQQTALVTCPGLSSFVSVSAVYGEGRAAINIRGTVYAVIGNNLYKVESSGLVTALGGIDGSGICGMSSSGFEIHISVFDTGYVFNIGTEVLTRITDAGYPQGYTTCFINGRFVTEDPTAGVSGRFFYSDLLDGSTWNALNYATAERKTDDAVAVWAFGESLLILGTRSAEFWTADASGFQPVPGALLPYGVLSKRSIAEAAGSLFFLDSDGQVRVLQGYSGEIVSTPAVQEAIAKSADAEGCAYVFEGKTIYEISTPTVTLCFDLTSSRLLSKPIWFRKSSADGRWAGRSCIDAYGSLMQMGYNDGNLYKLDRQTIPDAREFTVSVPADDDRRAWSIFDEAELIGRTGTGAIAAGDPQVMLRVSRDNGHVFDEEKWVGLGTVGKYAQRVRWRRLGRFQQCSLRFRQTDAHDWTVLGVRLRGR